MQSCPVGLVPTHWTDQGTPWRDSGDTLATTRTRTAPRPGGGAGRRAETTLAPSAKLLI